MLGPEMTKVVKFPLPEESASRLNAVAARVTSAIAPTALAMVALRWLMRTLRLLAFLILCWLRLPVIFLMDLISIPSLFAWLFSLYAFPDKHAMIWGFGIVSFAAFTARWLYDAILMAIAPYEVVRTL